MHKLTEFQENTHDARPVVSNDRVAGSIQTRGESTAHSSGVWHNRGAGQIEFSQRRITPDTGSAPDRDWSAAQNRTSADSQSHMRRGFASRTAADWATGLSPHAPEWATRLETRGRRIRAEAGGRAAGTRQALKERSASPRVRPRTIENVRTQSTSTMKAARLASQDTPPGPSGGRSRRFSSVGKMWPGSHQYRDRPGRVTPTGRNRRKSFST